MYNTLISILEQTVLYQPLIYGAYISISLMKQPDLSINSAYVMGAIFGAKAHFSLGILCSCIGGALVGLTTSTISKKGNIPYLLASIISIGIFHGMSLFILGSSYMSLNQDGITESTQIITVCTLIILGLLYLFFKTEFGIALAVYGNNASFFEHHGMSSSFILIGGICISHMLAGIAGYLFVLSNRFVEISMGVDIALLCITTIILGKTCCLSKKPINFFIPALGTFTYFTIQQLLLKSGFNLKYFTMVQAIIVLLVLIYFFSQKVNPNNFHNDSLGV